MSLPIGPCVDLCAGMYDSVCPPPEEAGFFLRVKGLQGKDMMGPGREGRGE